MYLQKPDHRRHVIKDLYTVWLPPIPDRKLIHGHALKREDQIWRRQPLPRFYEERRGEERHRQEIERRMVADGEIKKIQHFDDVLEKYRRQQWHYRIYGYWVMINGIPTYLTPGHWMYLQWTKLDTPENDGYPSFYYPQLDRYYFRQLCWEDPFCLGWIEVGPRGYGKTSELAGIVLDTITKPPHRRHVVIQSKTEEDAEEVIFQEKMVPIFNEYPDFFQPVYAHGTAPKDRMMFRQDSKKGESKDRVLKGEDWELLNTIKCFPAKVKAADGKTAAIAVADEVGKTHPKKEANVFERHNVHVKCVFRNDVKRGLIIDTTTIEEMDQGGAECFEIWSGSNPLERDGNGYTRSKVYKYLVTGMECKVSLADKFGDIPLNAAEEMIDRERAPVLRDPYKLSMIMRKDPKNEEEAFIKDQAQAMFNIFTITENINYLKKLQKEREKNGNGLKHPEPAGRQVRLEWQRDDKGKEIVDGDVVIIDDPQGPFTIFFNPNEYVGKRKILNACPFVMDDAVADKKLWLPVNNDMFRGGGDPIKWVSSSDIRASKLCAYGWKMFDLNLDLGKPEELWESDCFMWQYFHRSEDPDDDFENVIKAIRLFGHSIMPEGNITDLNKHLYARGYHRFIIARRDFDPSILAKKSTKNALGADQAVHSDNEVILSYINEIKRYWKNRGRRNKSLIFAEQCRDFIMKDRTKFDAVVGGGYCLMSLKAELPDFNAQNLGGNPLGYFSTYDISGHSSMAVNVMTDDGDPEENEFNQEYLEKLMRR